MPTVLWRRIAQSLLVVVMVWTGVGVAFPQTPNDVKVEIFHTGVWNNITTDVFDRATSPRITITRGRPDEGSRCDPGYATLSINNRTGKYSPRNPVSPLYGKIGRNTPIRISVTHNSITYIRFVGEITAWPSRWDLSENDVWVPIEAYGILRRLGQGASPLRSALYRAILDAEPVAFWSMEDGSTASVFGSVLPGGTPMAITAGAVAGASSPVHWIPAMAGLTITAGALGNMRAAIVGAQPTGVIAFGFGYQLVEGTETFSHVLIQAANGLRWRLYIDDLFDELVVEALDASGQIGGGGGWTASLVDGGLHHVMATIEQSGGNATIRVYVDGVELSLSSNTISAVTVAAPMAAEVGWQPGTPPPTQQAGELRIGSLAVWDTLPAPATLSNALQGHNGELVTTRLSRLAAEEGISMVITGTSTATMGPQRVATLQELLDDCAAVDRGFLHEQRTAVGLAYRSNRSRFNQ